MLRRPLTWSLFGVKYFSDFAADGKSDKRPEEENFFLAKWMILLTKILKPVMVQACWIKIVTTLLATKIQRIGLLTQRRYFLKRGGTSNGRQIYNSEYGLQCLELYRSRFITSARAVVPGGSFESFFLLSSVVLLFIIERPKWSRSPALVVYAVDLLGWM